MTLQRVLEPEVMDTVEEAVDYNAMDHAAVNRLFVDDLLAALSIDGDAAFEGEVLDLGTGTALIPIELCRRDESFRVLGVDLAANMLDVAKINIDLADLRERVMLDLVDAKTLPLEDARFAVVMSNSIIHHVPEPAEVLREAVRLTAPGGLLFFRDLLRPEDNEEVARLVEIYAGQESDHARQMFEDSLRAALSLEQFRALVQELGFEAQAVQATSDRHWTWSARKTK
ncbi:MAG: class I SAM-dependent methyltransferase [Planctomycetes bacterium]|nr:class I SAM-dependent methyltransferase [Planctomycetota bacterium]